MIIVWAIAIYRRATLPWLIAMQRRVLDETMIMARYQSWPIIPLWHPKQVATIYVNNIFMEKWEFTSDEAIEKRLPIPKEILAKNDLLIIIIISEDRISPHKLGLSDDKRKLGICLHWLQINSLGN